MTKNEFIEAIAKYVKQFAPEYGIAVHSPIIAQACLESAWNKSKLSQQYHNYFGLKCGSKWQGPSVNMTTSEEYTPGKQTVIKDNFRVYPDMEQGVKGYFEFIQLERYHNLRGITDPKKYLETIKGDGYATESDYVRDNMRIIEQYDLTQYDPKKGAYMAKYKTETAAIDALISTADAEVGYLEKKTNADLDSKLKNAGSNNYTKYWRDVKPSFQGESWCACFVSWCFMVTFGQASAEKLLKHWPFTYCQTLAAKTTNKIPKRGAVILFWRASKDRYGHTGIVYKVDATYVYTIEGNTSGGTDVVANGQGVHKKKYKLASLDSRTKYFLPDYSLVTSEKAPESLIPGTCDVTLCQFLPGAEHPQIRSIQALLNARGYKGKNGKALTIDGVYGTNTVYAMTQFQKAAKLDIKSPGTVGGKTWTALLN